MATSTAVWRIVTLLISAVLLSLTVYHGTLDLAYHGSQTTLTGRQADLEVVPTKQGSTTAPKSVALSFGRPDLTVNFSSPLDHHIKRDAQHRSKFSLEPHAKRAGKEDFDAAKKQGDIAYAEMQAAFAGCTKEVTDFDPSAFENGWTRKQDSKSLPEQTWQDVIKQVAGEAKTPTSDTSFYVNMIHDKDFTNSQGQPVKYIKPTIGDALYELHYIPASSAIIVSQTRSPAYVVKRRLGNDAPSNREINEKYVPPLNRWSDATWTLWKEKGGGNDLRYIGRDFIFNLQTESVMKYIFEKYGKEEGDRKFPGLDFGMDSDEGRALLGTPNGIGAARILIDRASELGRRDLRIHIFEPDEEYSCILVDMQPAQVQPRALGDRNGHSKRLLDGSKTRKKSKRYQKGSPSALRAPARRDKARLHARGHHKRHIFPSSSESRNLLDRFPNSSRAQPSPLNLGLLQRGSQLAEDKTPSDGPRPASLQHYGDDDNSTLTKRDAASVYSDALCTGRAMWAKITQAFDNPPSNPTAPIEDLENGWSKTDSPYTIDAEWIPYFNLKVGEGKIPPQEKSRYVALGQDKDFVNKLGGNVPDYSGTDEAGTAIYYTNYIPPLSALIVKNSVSPANVLKTTFNAMGAATPSNLEIAEIYTPPLSRWSDVTWTVYASICATQSVEPGKLQYIARDNVNNRFSQVVMA
ncbi:MAG: hypothetical protein Q9226_005209, partial [Calogaya cf. arnoldii]